MNIFKAEPYRVHFIIGALLAITGITPWLLFSMGLINSFPVVAHSRFLFFGFFMSFVSGFLMTAIPKMTSSFKASGFEIGISVFTIAMMVVSILLGEDKITLALVLVQFLLLIGFIGRRLSLKFIKNQNGLFFVPLGIFSGIIGTIILLFSDNFSAEVVAFGKLILYQGWLLNLLIGLGSRLIPMLSRKGSAILPIMGPDKANKLFFVQAIILNLSFPIEAFGVKELGLLIRAVVMTFVVVKNYRIFAPAVDTSFLARALTYSSIFLAAPYFLMVFFPENSIHLLHLVFISGLALMTLLVAMRVTIAHGGESTDIEKQALMIPLSTVVIIIASLIRSFGVMIKPEHFNQWILTSGLLWIFGSGLWLFYFGPKLWRTKGASTC